MAQLLWIETLLRFFAGLVLLILPVAAARVLGLPLPQATLWPRMLGGLLVGMAGATLLEGSVAGSRGLGLGGPLLELVHRHGAVDLRQQPRRPG